MFSYPSKGKYQYNIYTSYGGTPFFNGRDFYNYYEAQLFLRNIIETTDKRYRYNFYVDNNFYKNDVPLGLPKQRYYKIIKRKVSDYIDADYEFEEEQEIIVNDKKIIYYNFKNNS